MSDRKLTRLARLRFGAALAPIVFGLAPVSAAATSLQAAEQGLPVADEQAPWDGTEIIVSARRKDERLQDVPLTVNALSGETLARLNVRSFEEIAALVPGLAIPNVGNATIRGVAFNNTASGFNGTIEFYLNDSPGTSDTVFGQQFDIGQIEVLRGPQGTLRGRAAPSGSITVNTRRPNLHEVGGYVSGTGTSIGGINAQVAVGLPLIDGVLAVRLAGLVDESEGAGVRRFDNSISPLAKTKAARGAARFRPTDSLTFDLTYQRTWTRGRSYTQVESMSILEPISTSSPVLLTAGERASVQDAPSVSKGLRQHLNVQAQWSFAGQRLNYIGGWNKSRGDSLNATDVGNFFGPSAPVVLDRPYGVPGFTEAKNQAHELRLSSDAPIGGLVDYVVGAFSNVTTSMTNFATVSVSYNPIANTGGVTVTPSLREVRNEEKSVFGNLTLHLGAATELSGGLRYIDYQAVGSVKSGAALTPVPQAGQNDHFDAVIYSLSLKHNFSDDLMVYATTGSSWRPGVTAVGNFNTAPSPLERQFSILPPETSKSYEIGFKSTFLDKRLRFNLAAFLQDFQNYPYRSSGGQFFVNTNTLGTSVSTFNFVGAVPVEVYGLEAELAYNSENFDVTAGAAYANGKIKNGLVPCNDYFPRDGIPDSVSTIPTVAQIQAAGSTLSSCRVNFRASQSPLWNATIQSEYRLPVSSAANGFLRGQLTLNGSSLNDPRNPFDDVKAYALLNLFGGLRSTDGNWEVAAYAKNLTNTERVLSRGQSPLSTSYRNGATSASGVTTYRSITMTAPREFGLNVRYAFGSR